MTDPHVVLTILTHGQGFNPHSHITATWNLISDDSLNNLVSGSVFHDLIKVSSLRVGGPLVPDVPSWSRDPDLGQLQP